MSTLANAAAAGYFEVQNRSLLCNALISALEIPSSLPPALFTELLGYFVLLHADEPSTLLTKLTTAPAAVLAHPHLRLALTAASAFSRLDTVALSRCCRDASLLSAACLVRLLPAIRAASLAQANAAYTVREAFPVAQLCPRLALPAPSDAFRCVQAHGLLPAATAVGASVTAEEALATSVHFHSPGFVSVAAKLEPPLPPPETPAIIRYRQRQFQAAASITNAAVSACPAQLAQVQPPNKKKKRRPPPASFLASYVEPPAEEEVTQAPDPKSAGDGDVGEDGTKAPLVEATTNTTASSPAALSTGEWLYRLLHDGVDE